MDTREILTFVTVCDTLNYQKAAERLQYTPSTLFKHVRQLEAELGAPLFLRDGRKLALSDAGARFLVHAQRMLAEYRLALGDREKTAAELTVGGCEMNLGNSLLDHFSRFAVRHPEIRLSMMTAPNAAVPEMVRSGQVDIGYFYSTGSQHRGLQCLRMYREPAFLVAASSNPVVSAESLRYEDLAGMEFVYPHDTCCFVTMLMPELERRGVALKRVTYLGGMQLVLEQARRDGALTLAPLRALRRFEEVYGLRRLNLIEAPLYAWETILLGERAALESVQTLLRFSMGDAEGAARAEPMLRSGSPEG